MTYEPQQLIDAVQRSPQLVAAKDRDGWCSLYAQDGEVNDPVGSQPHQGRAAIERFYDTFIAPNGIVFRVERDFVCGMSVMRDLSIETTMSTGVKLTVPMHLRYDLVDEGGALKIRRLFAHWELLPMILQLLGTGPRGWWTALKLGPQLIANQGFGGVLGFLRGFLGVGGAGRRASARLLAALRDGDSVAAQALLEADATLECPAGTPVALPQLAAALAGVAGGKALAAGRYVSTTVSFNGRPGVVLLRFGAGLRVACLKVYA